MVLEAGLLLTRLAVGTVMLAHGWNHLMGGGRIAGTTRWFASLGMRPPAVHAWLATLTELGAGVLLLTGLLTPLAGAAVVGVMGVAWVTNHARNGFFIFHPGEGYEYVMTLTLCGASLCFTGAGRISIDQLLGLREPTPAIASLCLLIGVVSAGTTLALCWRPQAKV